MTSEGVNRLPLRKPEWLKVASNTGENNHAVLTLLRSLGLHTVCEEAHCPNIGECFGRRTATFMLLGGSCTRNCTFCAVGKNPPATVDPEEPSRLAAAVMRLDLRHVVITSVTRDDLEDGGIHQFVQTIEEIRKLPGGAEVTIEVLIPDLQGDFDALGAIVSAAPAVIGHNVETIPRLYPEVRPEADYDRSLSLLSAVKRINPQQLTKSGVMVGLGEALDELVLTLRDIRKTGCDILTIGQYLAPSKAHHPVVDYVFPSQFDMLRTEAESMGFSHVSSGPLVRSSYHAEQAYKESLSDGGLG